MRYYILAILVYLADQLSKAAVVRYMDLGESIPLWEGVFHLTSHRNAGAAFGILQNQRWFFIAVSVAAVVGIIYYLQRVKAERALFAFGLALILGGAAGNLTDRILTGEVVDFLDFILIRYPIFNLADSSIVIGVGLCVLDTLLEARKVRARDPIA